MQAAIFEQLLILLAASVLIITMFRKLDLPSILAYLVVGILFSLLAKHHFASFGNFFYLAKYGVVFLLFSIGLEFSFNRLIAMRRIVLGLGSMQVMVCGAALYIIGLLVGLEPVHAFVAAAALTLSSTALVSKLLTESGELQSQAGRVSIGILIFQDIMVVPLLIITGILGRSGDTVLWHALGMGLLKGVVTFGILYLISRLTFERLFTFIARARSNELFMLATLLIVLAAAFFTEEMGMSKELGAFLAGVMIASTPFHHQVEVDIRPFRDVLLGLFFIGIGMSINLDTIGHVGIWILLFGGLLVILKTVLIALITNLSKLGNRQQSFRVGVLLSQGGEFGFVIVALADNFKLLHNTHAQIILGSLIFSMIVSLLVIRFQKNIISLFSRKCIDETATDTIKLNQAVEQKQNFVIILGYGYVGQSVARLLRSQNIDFLAVDIDPLKVTQAASSGVPVYYGDALHKELLHNLRLKSAKGVAICLPQDDANIQLLKNIREVNPSIPVVLRTEDDSHFESFKDYHSVTAIPEKIETGLQLSARLMEQLNIADEIIDTIITTARNNAYQQGSGFFMGGKSVQEYDTQSHMKQLQSFVIEPNSYPVGKNINTLPIADNHLELVEIRQASGNIITEPQPGHIIKAGSVYLLRGTLINLETFAAWLAEEHK